MLSHCWQDEHHILTNSSAGNLGAVAGNSDPWRCGLASSSLGSWINSAPGSSSSFCGRRSPSRSLWQGSSCLPADNVLPHSICFPVSMLPRPYTPQSLCSPVAMFLSLFVGWGHSHQFPHSAFALSCVRGKNAGVYGCYLGVQCRPPYTVYSYQFLPVISSVMITCTYPFTVDDNHLQKSTILSSAICCFTVLILSSHYINFSLINCVRKFDREIIWNFCVLRLLWVLYYTSVHNTFCIIWRAT